MKTKHNATSNIKVSKNEAPNQLIRNDAKQGFIDAKLLCNQTIKCLEVKENQLALSMPFTQQMRQKK